MMNWLNPVFLAVTAAVLVAAILCWRIGAWRKKRALVSLLGNFACDRKIVKLSRPRRFWRHVLLGVAIIALGITAARPFRKKAPEVVSATGRDVLVLFDVSKSMRSVDLAPSRLEHARYLLREIVSAFPGDRFGLIAFAGRAYLSCPLTNDAVAFEQYVDELSTDSVPVGGTDLEVAFATALRALESAGGGEKSLLVITDGEELTGDSSRMIAKLKEAKVQVIIVGVGDPAGAPVLDDQGVPRHDAGGKVILSRLNEVKLREVADACGGVYIHSQIADNGFAAIKAALLAHHQRVQKEMNRAIPVEEYTIPLGVAIAALIAYFLISERARALLLILALSVWSVTAAENSTARYREAVELQKKGEAAQAIAIYEKLLADPATSAALAARVRQNLGVIPHETARRAIADAQKAVKNQQLDAALQKLGACEKEFSEAESYYAGAFEVGATDFDTASLSADLALLDADRREAEELKKKIEKLKAQQQQARNQAQKAKEENQKNRQKQDQQKASSASQKEQGQKEDQSLADAAKAAQKLKESAEKMKQEKLREAAEKAQQSLERAREAQRQGDRDAADQKIDEALAALGKEAKGKKPDKPEAQSSKGDEKKDDAEKSDTAKEEKNDPEKKENDRVLQQMLDRENKRRRQLVPRQGEGRIPTVEKDW